MATLNVNWMIQSDMERVLEIENACFDIPWSKDDFKCVLRQSGCLGMVTEDLSGFVIYELHPRRIEILNLAVHPGMQRTGSGSVIISWMKSHLNEKRFSMSACVRESNVNAQLFFRAMGFRVSSVVKNYYEEVDEDAYVFSYLRCFDV